jgi:hypothetical protein
MREYTEYFSGIDKSIARCDSLSKTELKSVNNQTERQNITQYRAKYADFKRTSKRGNFNISDLLRLPYQRVLKYHLLFEQLKKSTDSDHSAKGSIEQMCLSMTELARYLNECQRDNENLSTIGQIIQHFHSLDSGSAGIKLILSKDYGHYLKVIIT